jgi:hypothetical protein
MTGESLQPGFITLNKKGRSSIMSDFQPNPEQAIEGYYDFADNQIFQGAKPNSVKNLLIEQGLDAETAGTIVKNVRKAKAKAHRQAGLKSMICGGLCCILGVAVTAITLQMASGPAGGHYVVAWGAILFGGIQCLRGLIQTVVNLA